MNQVTKLKSLFLFVLAVPGIAVAQTALEARLLACDGISDLSQRLNCFNDVVDAIRPGQTRTDTQQPEVPAIEDSNAADIAIDDAATGDVADVVASATASVAAVEVTEAVNPEPIQNRSNVHEETTMTVDETERGYQPVERRPLEDAPLPTGALIVEVWSNNDGRFSVKLDNGQVWRETQGSRVGKPRVGRTIEVIEGRFGGERMRIEGIRKLAWVRRME